MLCLIYRLGNIMGSKGTCRDSESKNIAVQKVGEMKRSLGTPRRNERRQRGREHCWIGSKSSCWSCQTRMIARIFDKTFICGMHIRCGCPRPIAYHKGCTHARYSKIGSTCALTQRHLLPSTILKDGVLSSPAFVLPL